LDAIAPTTVARMQSLTGAALHSLWQFTAPPLVPDGCGAKQRVRVGYRFSSGAGASWAPVETPPEPSRTSPVTWSGGTGYRKSLGCATDSWSPDAVAMKAQAPRAL